MFWYIQIQYMYTCILYTCTGVQVSTKMHPQTSLNYLQMTSLCRKTTLRLNHLIPSMLKHSQIYNSSQARVYVDDRIINPSIHSVVVFLGLPHDSTV